MTLPHLSRSAFSTFSTKFRHDISMFNLILILCTLRICMMNMYDDSIFTMKKYGNDIFLHAFFSMEGEGGNESEVLSFWRKEAALILPAISFTMVLKPERSPKCWCIFCWILKISIDNSSIWFDVERTYHMDRTIHLNSIHLTPFYLETAYCHGKVWVRMKENILVRWNVVRWEVAHPLSRNNSI